MVPPERARAQDSTLPSSAGRSSRQRRHSRSAPYPVAVRPLPQESSLYPEVELRDERPPSQDCRLRERNSLQGLLYQHEGTLVEESKFEEETLAHEEAPQHEDSSLPPQMTVYQETSVTQGRLQLQGVSRQEHLLHEDRLLRDGPLVIAERIQSEEMLQIAGVIVSADLLQGPTLPQEHQEMLQHLRNMVHEQVTVHEEDLSREEDFLHDENSLRGHIPLPPARLPLLASQVNHPRDGNLPDEASLPCGDTPLCEVSLPRRQSVLSEGNSPCRERLQTQPSLLPTDVLRSPTRTCTQEHPADSTQQNLYQLVVRPIVKTTIGQRDTSGNILADTIVSGGSFTEILQQLWDPFAPPH
ncbi:hypothetical protein PF004_g29665 [Phytophthora fragariae]|nr:hypothetical protein PF004_g29665 [Phytophthora fragariae]